MSFFGWLNLDDVEEIADEYTQHDRRERYLQLVDRLGSAKCTEERARQYANSCAEITNRAEFAYHAASETTRTLEQMIKELK